MKKLIFLLFLFFQIAVFSQNNSIEGQIVDSKKTPISFVNLLLFEKEDSQVIAGTTTNEAGFFRIDDLEEKEYYLEIRMIGFSTISKTINPSKSSDLGIITLTVSQEELDEAVISVKSPSVKKEPGKLTFNVENTSLSTGSTFNLLKKTPGVLIIGDKISIKNTSPIIYLNDKRVYLSSSELASLLKSVDASEIKSIEVITNPSAKYDAEAGAILNIVSSKTISIGYKGSVNATYEQAVYSKYMFSTSHSYKNDWLNLSGNYSYSPRKDYKQDDNFTRFFNPDDSAKTIWESDFTKTTRSYGHQGNIILDFTLNDKNSLSLSTTAFVSPDKKFNNNVTGEIFDAQRQLDSTFITESSFENNTSNWSFNAEHQVSFGDSKSKLSTSLNYIIYANDQSQNLNTDYFLPSDDLLNTVNFFTDAYQDTDIFTGQTDFKTTISEGDFEAGLKYSNIETASGLDFFNTENNIPEFVDELSDLFIYKESIYASYINYLKEWDQWSITVGLRGEYTNVDGDSKSLGIVNSQEYFDVFPSGELLYTKNDDNTFGLSYRRSVVRPRYQSLNPFSYFITDNIIRSGNPNLIPTIKTKYMLSFTHKNKWFFEAYYIYKKNPLAILTFQDNENSNLQNIDANIINDVNYSLDVMYSSSVNSWWYLWVYTSAYYLENEFFALASTQETYSNNTFGVYAQMYSGLTLSKDKSFTSDVTFKYISNMIEGSFDYKNQFNLSVSFRKSFWNNKASVSAGVDDIFDTFNVPLSSKYYNQDNSYFAHLESRLFRLGFVYYFGNFKLRNTNNSHKTAEEDRLN